MSVLGGEYRRRGTWLLTAYCLGGNLSSWHIGLDSPPENGQYCSSSQLSLSTFPPFKLLNPLPKFGVCCVRVSAKTNYLREHRVHLHISFLPQSQKCRCGFPSLTAWMKRMFWVLYLQRRVEYKILNEYIVQLLWKQFLFLVEDNTVIKTKTSTSYPIIVTLSNYPSLDIAILTLWLQFKNIIY